MTDELAAALERLLGEVEWNGDIPYLVHGDQVDPEVWIQARDALRRHKEATDDPG